MPLALDPNETFPVVLKSDAARPEPRPAFLFRHPTRRTALRLRAIFGLPAEVITSDVVEEVWVLVESRLAGWRDFVDGDGRPVLFGIGRSRLEEVCTEAEIWELAADLLAAGRLTSAEKKASSSPSPSAKDSSAPAAGGA